MPIHEYACRACGAEMEKLQRMSDAPLTTCPECGEAALVRKISAAGFRLKGGGWYETDFKASGKRNLAGDKGGDAKGKDKPPTESADKAKPKQTEKSGSSKPAAKSGDSANAA